MSIEKEEFEGILAEKFPNSTIEVVDTIGDGDHYRVKISSQEFNSLTRIAKHRLVNERLRDYIGNKIHAVEFILV